MYYFSYLRLIFPPISPFTIGNYLSFFLFFRYVLTPSHTHVLAGHLADSVLPFSGLVHTTNDDQDNGDQAGYTNLEMFDYLAPDSEDLS
jgi:hypothetical protein